MTNKQPEIRYVVIVESVAESLAKDFGSLGALAGLIYVNHQFGQGHWLVDALGTLLAFSWLVSRSNLKTLRRWTREELRAWARSTAETWDADNGKAG